MGSWHGAPFSVLWHYTGIFATRSYNAQYVDASAFFCVRQSSSHPWLPVGAKTFVQKRAPYRRNGHKHHVSLESKTTLDSNWRLLRDVTQLWSFRGDSQPFTWSASDWRNIEKKWSEQDVQ